MCQDFQTYHLLHFSVFVTPKTLKILREEFLYYVIPSDWIAASLLIPYLSVNELVVSGKYPMNFNGSKICRCILELREGVILAHI